MKLLPRLSRLFLLCCFLYSTSSPAQTIVEHDFRTQRRQLAFYNIGLGSLIGGVGALLNKKEDEKWHRVLLKGMGQGALGGYINYEAKRFAYLIPKTGSIEYAWGSRLIHSVGSSIIENAASNRELWASWKYNLGPLRIELDKRNNYRPKAKIQLIALYANIFIGSKGKFNLDYTLRSGGMVFTSDKLINLNGRLFGGLASTTAFVIHEDSNSFLRLFAHEMLHTLQYQDYAGINRHFDQPLKLLKEEYPLLQKASKWLYLDWHYGIRGGLYLLEKRWSNACYYNNFFELEVEHFARQAGIPTCE